MDWKDLYTNFEGRIGRQQWWIGVAGLFVLMILSRILLGNTGLLAWVVSMVLLVLGLAVHIKRFHDRGKSGWWSLVLFIPVVGLIWAIIDLEILEGDSDSNAYGPPPTGRALT